MRKQSLFAKFVLFGCALCIIPVLALGFFSYMKSSSSVQDQVNRSNIQLMRQTKSNIEQVLRTVDYTLNYVINTNKLQEALYRPLTFYDFELYNELKEELTLLQSTETRVTDVIIANAASDWIINNRGLYTYNDYASVDTLDTLLALEGSTEWVLLETGLLGSSDTQSYSCPYTVTLVKKMPLYAYNERGIAIATIPSCSLAAMLDDPLTSSEVMVLGADNRIIVHPDPALIGSTLTEAGYMDAAEQALLPATSSQFEIDDGDDPVSVTVVRSDFNGWTYISFTELAALTKESRSIGWFTFYVCLAIIGLSFLFVWLGSRRMYSPIRSIFEQLADRLPELQANTKNELQVIDEHIRELFDSNTQLRSELHKSSEQLRTFFLQRLFLGQVAPAAIPEKLTLFGYAKQAEAWEHLAVFTLQIDLLDQTRYGPKDLDLLLFAIHNMIEELVPTDERLQPVIIDQTLVTLVGRGGVTPGQFSDYIYKLSEHIQQTLQTYLHLDVSIGISLPFHVLRQAPRAYREGMEALKQRLKLGMGVIVPYYSLNEGRHTRVYFYPMQVHNELIDAIKLADEPRAEELLDKWLEQVFMKDRTPQEYQISLIRLLNDLMIVMQEAGIRLDQLQTDQDSLYEQLLEQYALSEIALWFKSRIMQPMIRVFRDRQTSQYQNISEQIIEIIRSEYDTDLTLEKCAARLHYNNFYLSSVFKKETNMSFSEYLSQYRFNMSKKWLIETDMPIKEIAERLTYNNPQNFIRSFRKLEGMTPGQYRSKYANADG